MSKSKFGESNLYMTTREFADLVVTALEDQNYFRSTDPCHPQDIAQAFVTVGETIGATMAWAIKEENKIKNKLKEAVMKTGDLNKNVSGSWASASSSSEHRYVLPIDEEIAPQENGYSEWKRNGYL
jgi:hypothetical protein